MSDGVELTVTEGIAHLALLHGDLGNPLDPALVAQLRAGVANVASNADVRALFIRSRGRNFCFGGNFKTLSQAADLASHVRHITVDYHEFIEELLALPVPIFSVLQGGVAGAGIALGVAADYVLAREDAHFTLAFAKLGATPDGATTFLIPRLIGMRRFQELLISNRRVGAAEAVAMGLVTEVVAADLFERRIGELETLAQGLNRAAVAETRALILASYSNNLTEQLDRESRTLSRRCSSDEMKAALGAMVASRRRPSKPSDEN